MDKTKPFTVDEAHEYLAKSFNGRVWELIQKPSRTQAEDDEMLHAAHACTYHWKFVGTAIQQQRGEWLISHVHALLEHSAEALRHAERSFELTESNKDMMQHFDIAYAYEGLARAYALAAIGRRPENFSILPG